MEKYYLPEMTREEIKNRLKSIDIMLLPVGSIEQHGPHLPVDTDAYDALYLCMESVARLSSPKPLVLAPLYYGVSYHHIDFPGTISILPETLATLVYEIAESLHVHGVRKFVIVNGHGGNIPALRCAAQKIRWKLDMLVCVVSGEFAKNYRRQIFSVKNDVHAGEFETSTSLANRRDKVCISMISRSELKFPVENFQFSSENYIPHNMRVKDIAPTGVLGDPTKASAEKGEKYWDYCIDVFSDFLEKLRSL